MIDLLHDLSDWLLELAETDWAVLGLAVSSFAESIFFPIPPDPMLIGMAIARPDAALWFGVLVTVCSVSGAILGHWLGRRFGRPLLYRMFSQNKIQPVEDMFRRYGLWAILLAAVTPLPYKVFAITAGVLDLDRRTFVLASIIGRGTRFLALGLLVFVFGESIKTFIDNNFEVLTIGMAAALVGGFAALGLVGKRRRAGGVVVSGQSVSDEQSEKGAMQ